MQEHMSVEENQALGSTPFTLMVSFRYAPFVRHLSIIFATTTIMQCFLIIIIVIIKFCFVIHATLKYILLCNFDWKPNNINNE